MTDLLDDYSEPILVPKSVLKEMKKGKPSSDKDIDLGSAKKAKKPLSEAQRTQRSNAAKARVQKQARLKRKNKFMESVSAQFDEDEEGALRRWNPTGGVKLTKVEETPLENTPAAQVLQENSGIEEAPEATFDQVFAQGEEQRILKNKAVIPDLKDIASLAFFQNFDRRIHNVVQESVSAQGVVYQLPTYHRTP